MFPVSGAWQLQAIGARPLRPMISHSGAYSVFVRPAPYSSSGRKRFHRPISFALAFSSTRTAGMWCGSPDASICCCATYSAG